MNPLWSKLRGDVRSDRGRLFLTFFALTLSLAGLGIMLDAYAVLIREVTRNYEKTVPASATIEMDAVSQDIATKVSQLPGVVATERRRAVDARVRDGADWRPLRLFIIEDFQNLRLNTFAPQEGVWPPPTGTILLERTATRLMGLKTGDAITVRSPNGEAKTVSVSGLVHDAGLAPSEQERTVYGYASEETLRFLGETGGFDELRLRLTPESHDRAAIAAKCTEIVAWLQSRGQLVHELRIPPPGRHPHQGPMEAVLLSFIGFGVMALLLSAVLMATTMSALLAKQVREIAVLKAIGGGRWQIAIIYGTLALAMGVAATLLAVPLGLMIARPFTTQISTLINFTILSNAVPWHILLLQVATGIGLPILAAIGPIYRAVNIPVRVGLADHGVSASTAPLGEERAESRFAATMPLWIFAWRNTLRRRTRFALTLVLLATSGAILMSAFNLKAGWMEIIGRVYSERSYDASFQLRSAEPADRITSVLREVPEIIRAEAWQTTPVAFETPGGVPVVATYPDGGHGAFTLYGAPTDTQMVAFPLLAGRWLRPEDTDQVVLNHAARAARPSLKIGDRVRLNVQGKAREWTIVGFVEEVGSAAAAYVPRRQFSAAETGLEKANLLRITLSSKTAADNVEAIRRIEQILDTRGIRVTVGLPSAELKTAMGAHIAVLISTLIAAGLVMGTVAGLGLSAMLSMSVIERTREFGILRAIGSTPKEIARLVVIESLAMGVIGVVAAIPLSIGVSTLLGRIVGMTAFQIPLPINFSGVGLAVCFIGLLILVIVAAGLPARAAARLPVRLAMNAP